jgi:spore coat protein U-like protein
MLLAVISAQAQLTTCTVSTSGVAFGSFNPLPGQSANTTGTISVTCSGVGSASYTVTINSGLGSFSARKMFAGGHSLTYNLYKDSGFTQVWGDGTVGTVTVTGSATVVLFPVTTNYAVYSRIASGQNTARAGSYADSLVVTVTY